jgi:hypothetical protein
MKADLYNAIVQQFLSKAASEGVDIPSDVLDEFGEACKKALVMALRNDRVKEPFRLRMSNIGRPLCQLQREREQAEAEPEEYNFPMKMAIGHLVEALVVAVLRLADFKLESINATGSAELAGQKINGEIDFCINDEIWDVKSASGKSFRAKFAEGSITPDNDAFGYLAQKLGYGRMLDKKFGGWIAVNKETGEIFFAADQTSEEDMEKVRKSVSRTITSIVENKPFVKCFDDEPETYYKKETGNRILGRTCGYCKYKKSCWPAAKFRPRQVGNAKDPAWFWYTHIEEPKDE